MHDEYGRATELTKRLERRVAERTSVDPAVDRRTVLGGLGIAGSAAIAGFGSSSAASHGVVAGNGPETGS